MGIFSNLWKAVAAGGLAFFVIYAWNASMIDNPDAPYLPRAVTPGLVDRAISKADVCSNRISTSSFIAPSIRQLLFQEYGIRTDLEGFYLLSFLVPLDLGGSNDVANIWPQPVLVEYGSSKKSVLDKRLKQLVCSGKLSLSVAQADEESNWIETYKAYVH